MTLDLHVLGPAFGLPSVDAECLATIVYLALAVPKQQAGSSEAQWVIVPDAEIAAVPTNEFPALRDASGNWTSGFRNIVQYLQQSSDGRWYLDSWMSKEERADCVAYSAFITGQASRLNDLSLFVSSENYDGATQKEIFKMLNYWPNTWIVPRRMRNEAKARTAHLGLEGLDTQEAVKDMRQDSREAAVESQIPNSLEAPRTENLTSKLQQGSTVSSIRIQLDTLVDKLVRPLDALLSSQQPKAFLIGDGKRPSSLECIAIGYLSLALTPKLPAPWLRDTIASKSPRLMSYVQSLQIQCFGEEPYTIESLPLRDVGSPFTQQGTKRSRHELPICLNSPPPALRTIATTVIDTVFDSVPIISSLRRNRGPMRQPSRPDSPNASDDEPASPQALEAVALARRRERLATWGTYVLGGAAFVAYLLASGIVSISLGGQQDDDAVETEGRMTEKARLILERRANC